MQPPSLQPPSRQPPSMQPLSLQPPNMQPPSLQQQQRSSMQEFDAGRQRRRSSTDDFMLQVRSYGLAQLKQVSMRELLALCAFVSASPKAFCAAAMPSADISAAAMPSADISPPVACICLTVRLHLCHLLHLSHCASLPLPPAASISLSRVFRRNSAQLHHPDITLTTNRCRPSVKSEVRSFTLTLPLGGVTVSTLQHLSGHRRS